MFKLRDYQIDLSIKGCEILRQHKLLALMFECRVGKTLTALNTMQLYGVKHLLFLTKKKAMSSIQSDYEALKPNYQITILNHESLHKANGDYDAVVIDECHVYSQYPKPSERYKKFKQRFSHLPIILVSATFSPESYSQLYHPFALSKYSPFQHRNFYAWAKEFVRVVQRRLPHGTINDYSDADYEKIQPFIEPLSLKFTQADAGFICQITEHICPVEMPQVLKRIADQIMDCGVFRGHTGILSADGPAAMLQKVHQLHSGTIILDEDDDGKRQRLVLSDAKAQYIADTWPTGKLVIFYVYKHEYQAIKQAMGDRVTNDLAEFHSTDKSCAYQVVSGREGLNLSLGEVIIFYNISHSATSYWQARDRLTTSTRRKSDIYWLFSRFDSKWGIEHSIYKVVMDKKKYTTKHFQQEYLCSNQRSKPSLSKDIKRKDITASRSLKPTKMASPIYS